MIYDLEYTICYYISFKEDSSVSYCRSPNRFNFGVVFPLIPYMFRIIQCAQLMILKKKTFGSDYINIIKHCLGFTVTIFQLFYYISQSNYERMHVEVWLILWIIASIPLGFFASIWDIKVSWGFLAKGAKHKYLRSTLSLKKHPKFYYLAFAINFLLRLFWVLAISPGVTVFFKQPYICMLVFGFIELVRRVLWNFLTMENMHII